MRTFDSRVVAIALGVSPKWLDNTLSHHQLPDVDRSRQGRPRRITQQGVLALEISRLLIQHWGVTVWRSAEIARALMARRTNGESRFDASTDVSLLLDLDAIEARLRDQIVAAVETAPRIRRGRPPRTA